MISFSGFVADVMSLVDESPRFWRKGQAVFNMVDTKYGVARDVQFKDKIDCFYDDKKIADFLAAAYKRLPKDE